MFIDKYKQYSTFLGLSMFKNLIEMMREWRENNETFAGRKSI